MTPIKLATVGIIAAGATFGALTASAAPINSLGSIAKNTARWCSRSATAVGGPMATATVRGPIIAPTAVGISATITSDLIGGRAAPR